MKSAKSPYPWVWTGTIGIAALLAVLFLEGGDWAVRQGQWVSIAVVVIPVFLSFLGAVIVTHQPGNRIGYLLLVTGAGVLVTGLLDGLYGTQVGPPADPTFLDYLLIWVMSSTGSAFVIYPITLLIYLFPTGAFLSRRWSWAFWLPVALVSLVALVAAIADEVGPFFADQGEVRWLIDNPIGVVPIAFLDLLVVVWSVFLVVILPVGAAVSLIMRYRRSSLVIQTQIRWIIYGSVVAAVAFPLGVWFLADSSFADVLFTVSLLVVPITITLAITRYRLFEIDRLISRTVSYALVVGFLGLVFATGVVWIPAALGLAETPLIVAASTLAVAALFNPLRTRIQRIVDRRFNRSQYRAEQVAELFADQLRHTMTVPQLSTALIETVDTYLEPTSSAIWLRDRRGIDRVQDYHT
jgi:hypothetical protein